MTVICKGGRRAGSKGRGWAVLLSPGFPSSAPRLERVLGEGERRWRLTV